MAKNKPSAPEASAPEVAPEVAPEELAPSLAVEPEVAPEAAPEVAPEVLPSGASIESRGFEIVDNTDVEVVAEVQAEGVERDIGNGFTVVEYL